MANRHASPTMMQMQQQQQQQQHQGPPGAPPPSAQQGGHYPAQQIAAMNEAVWLQIGSFSELLRVPDEAMQAYERALQANPNSTGAMSAIGMLLKGREAFDKALEFFRAIVQIEANNGEAWGNLGHCYLMTENLQKAYDAYQQALVNLRDPKDPMLWYGIGILYDRYGSYDYAEEAFSQVMQIQPEFEKANEIYFRLGIIYKQQSKFSQSLECFKYIVNSPPGPLTQEDIWFQIGHVHEQQKDFDSAKAAYQRVLDHSPNHAKVLQQLGWLHHQQNPSYESQDRAIQYLEKSVGADNSDAQSWYLLGRCYMAQQKYPKAYEAYQQAVYRDGKNPTFWCSIGVLYYQINQYRDALDAYSRAIRLNPYISEVWYDLGTLYESCNNQIADALDAYQRAAELDPSNPHIKARLQLLRSGQANGAPPPAAPQPADVHPQAYQAAGPSGPSGWGGSTAQPPAAAGPAAAQGVGERWAGSLSNVNPPPQPPNPYESRAAESFRGGPAPPVQQRPPSPGQDQGRPGFSDHGRGGQPPRHPSPGPPPASQYGQHGSQAQSTESRVANPNWGGSVPSAAQPPASGTNGSVPPNGAGPFRSGSPRGERLPPADVRAASPKSSYPPHQAPSSQYPPQSEAVPKNGASAPPGPEASAAQRPEERPSSTGPKRGREWEEESASKKQANEENKARLEDHGHRRPSSPLSRDAAPVERAEEPRKQEEPVTKTDEYHPSEAAHHPRGSGTNQLPPVAPLAEVSQEKPAENVAPKEEPAASDPASATATAPAAPAALAPTAAAEPEPERAARKMDVDEDYDDAPEDDKKAASTNGAAAEPAKEETKEDSSEAAATNGTDAAAAKSE